MSYRDVLRLTTFLSFAAELGVADFPGFSFDDVQKNCGFPLLKAESLQTTTPPTEEELRVLRTEVDPNRIIIGR